MDFARKQLEKYGWTDGKGLGKNETGMSEALKPKLKRSMTGVGHNAAADFTEHWWSTLYNKAASNIEVKEKNGTTKKIKTKDDSEFEITNSTWKLKRKKSKPMEEKPQEKYEDFFVKTVVLGSGGIRTERIKESESESEDEKVQKDVFKMTDEELFAACEGRTAHKGARHGLKALGKLARIEQQEKLLLQQARFNGYSHAKKSKENREYEEEILEVASLNCDEDVPQKKKKKKKKHCIKQDKNDCQNEELNDDLNKSTKEETKSPDSNDEMFDPGNTDIKGVAEASIPRKVKKKKRSTTDETLNDEKMTKTEEVDEQCDVVSNDKKRKKRRHVEAVDGENCDTDVSNMCKVKLSKKNKKHID